jgi:hypothetical protein
LHQRHDENEIFFPGRSFDFEHRGFRMREDGRWPARSRGAIREGSARAVYERPVLQCWAAAKDVLNANGTITSEDVMQSTLSARVDTRTVWVKVESLDPKTTRQTVQVRTKAGRSDLDLAGEIDKQIAIRLATGTLSPTTPPGAR